MGSTLRVIIWMGSAFCATAGVGFVTMDLFGVGRQGTQLALLATARVAFLLFWAGYAGGPLATLFAPRFAALRRQGREFGLAFASALTAHMCIVAWLCWIGAAPAIRVFLFFGLALFCTYGLAVLSIARFRNALGPRRWRIVRALAMNDIALAFAVDFFRHPFGGSLGHAAAYIPFALLSVIGAALYFGAAVMQGIGHASGRSSSFLRAR